MDTKDIRSILGYEEALPNLENLHLTPEQTALLSSSTLPTSITHTPHRHMWDQVASLFTAYRLVDIFAAYHELSQVLLPSMTFNKIVPKTLTQEMANGLKILDKLKDWPNVLRSARKAVENSIPKPRKDLVGMNNNKTWTLLGSVARRNTQPMFDKVADNFQMAALHYTVMTEMRGVQNDGNILPDLPENLITLVSTYGQDDVESLTRITEFLNNTTASRLRIPLHLALMVSPILLLVNYQLHKTRCDRISLLIIQKALGNARPPALKEIELEIFRTLLQVSQNQDITTELVKLVNSAKWRQCEALLATNPACDFFCPLGSLQDTSGIAIGPSSRDDFLITGNTDSTNLGMSYNSMNRQDVVLTTCKVGYAGPIHRVEDTSKLDFDALRESSMNSSVEETRNQDGAGSAPGNGTSRCHAGGEGVVTTVHQSNTASNTTSGVDGASSCVEIIQKHANSCEGGSSTDDIRVPDFMGTTVSSTGLLSISNDLRLGEIVIASGLVETAEHQDIVTPPEDNMSVDEVDLDIEDDRTENETSSLTDNTTPTNRIKDSRPFLSTTTDRGPTEHSEHDEDTFTATKGITHILEGTKPLTNKPKRKRKRQNKNQIRSKVEKKGQQPIEKSSNPEAEIEDSLYIDVDLWNPMAISLDVKEEPPKIYGSEITTYTAFGDKVEFRPCAHDQHTLNIIEVLWSQIKSKYVNNKPEFLSSPENSCIAIIRTEDMASYSDHDLLQILKKKHIVTVGEGDPAKTFRDALRSLGSITTVRTVQDQSISAHDNYNERCQKGTLKQLLQASQSKKGKILNALDIPLPATGPFSSPISSDVKALFATQGSWKTSFALSTGDVRWGLAATTGAFHTWHIDSNGFATFILPLSGSKWWILARPKSPDARERFDVNLFLDGRFDLDKACDDLWTLEAILLVPGTRLYMRPNTPHAVYTPESAVVDGGHFYPSVALEDVLVDPCLDHIPDYRTKDGYTNILALCIYGVLMNVLDFDTYRHPQQLKVLMTEEQKKEWMDWDQNILSVEQRKACMYARGQCLQIMDWLSRRIRAVHIMECQDTKMKTKTKSLAASLYQEKLLVAYCSKIYAYKQVAEEKNIQGAPTCDKRLLKVQLDGVLSGKLNQLIQKGILDPQTYGRYQEDHVIARIEVRESRTSQAKVEVDLDPNILLREGMSFRDVLYERGQAIKHEHIDTDLTSSSPAKKRRRS